MAPSAGEHQLSTIVILDNDDDKPVDVSFRVRAGLLHALGLAIYNAANDPAAKARMHANAKRYLVEQAGGVGHLPANVIDLPKMLLPYTIVVNENVHPADPLDTSVTDNVWHITLPAETEDLNDTTVFPTQQDKDRYLHELGFVTIMGCRRRRP